MKRLVVFTSVILLLFSLTFSVSAAPVTDTLYDFNGHILPIIFEWFPDNSQYPDNLIDDYRSPNGANAPKKHLVIVRADVGYILYYSQYGYYYDNGSVYLKEQDPLSIFINYVDITPDYWSYVNVETHPKDGFIGNVNTVIWSSNDIYTNYATGNSVAIKGDSFFSSGDWTAPEAPEEDKNVGFFQRIINWLSDFGISFKVYSLSMGQWFDSIGDYFTTLTDQLPLKIKDVLSDIFVPDPEDVKEKMLSFSEELGMKFGLHTDVFNTLFDDERPVEDVNMDYNIPGIGNFKLKVFDASFFKDGVEYFRPLIRGFLVLLMVLFHVKQVQSFFGYNAGVVAGRSDEISTSIKEQRKGK